LLRPLAQKPTITILNNYFCFISENRKTTPDDLYFVTLSIVGWLDLLVRETHKNILVDNLTYRQSKEKLDIFAYVIISNHSHLVCRRRDDDLKRTFG
jgi:putative transposase